VVEAQHGDPGRHPQRRTGAGVERVGEDDALRALVDELVDGPLPLLGRVLDRADDRQRVARGPRRVLDPVEHGGGPVQGRAHRDHPEQARVAGDQGARGGVGPEAELLDGREHPVAGGGCDVPLAVDHAGDGLLRDSGAGRHVVHGHAARRSLHPTPPLAV
jgi:hypothetical protein